MGESICKRCGVPIIWLTLSDGKKIPADVEKVEFVTRDEAGALTLTEGRPAHWETCENPLEEEEG